MGLKEKVRKPLKGGTELKVPKLEPKPLEENLLKEEHAREPAGKPVTVGEKGRPAPKAASDGILEVYESPKSYETPISKLAKAREILERKPAPALPKLVEEKPAKVFGEPLDEVRKAGVVETVKPAKSAVEEERIKRAVLEKMKSVSKEFVEGKKEKKIEELQKIIPSGSRREEEEASRILKERLAAEKPEKVGGVAKQLGSIGSYVKGGLIRKMGGKTIQEKDMHGFSKEETKEVKRLVKKLQPATKQYAIEEIKAAMLLEGVSKKVCSKVIELLYQQ